MCGRVLKLPKTGVRPTQDRVRQALFSIVACRIAGADFLDLFAGSGAVGLEAWSRGAESVCWVESSARVAQVLQENVRQLCPGGAGCMVRQDALTFLRGGAGGRKYDIVFADPPYTDRRKPVEGASPSRAEGVGAQDVLKGLESAKCLKPAGLVVIEHSYKEKIEVRTGAWRLTDQRVYGGTALSFFAEEGGADEERGDIRGNL